MVHDRFRELFSDRWWCHFPWGRHEGADEAHELVLEYGREVQGGARSGCRGCAIAVKGRDEKGEALQTTLLGLGGG